MKKYIASSIATMIAMSIAMPAFAQDGSTPPPPPASSSESGKKMKKPAPVIDTACMVSAVDKRDTAIIGAVDAFSTAVKTALETRRDALKAAWAISDKTQRNAALKAAWAGFQGTWKTASQALRTQKKDAWSAFNADAKQCKQPGAEGGGQKMDVSI